MMTEIPPLSRRSRWVGLALLVGVLWVLVGVALLRPARAEPPPDASSSGAGVTQQNEYDLGVPVPKEYQNMREEFLGEFQLAATAYYTNTDMSPRFADLGGAVQLAPEIQLAPLELTDTPLPEPLRNMGVVALGKYIFVIGGNRRGAEVTELSDAVYMAEVNQSTGNLRSQGGSSWRQSTLPAITTNNEAEIDVNDSRYGPSGFEEVAGITGPAVASVETGSNSGYIYVIGGQVWPGYYDGQTEISISSAAVRIGRVSGGNVTWEEGPMLMEPGQFGGGRSYGLEDAVAATYETSDGRVFLYVIGGYHNLPPHSDGSNYVFYAEVNQSTGQLMKPGTTEEGWVALEDDAYRIPPLREGDTVLEDLGLWRAAAMTYESAIFVFGGQRRGGTEENERFSNVVYRMDVSDADGTISWNEVGFLPDGLALYDLGVIQFMQAVYTAGGREIEQKSPTSDSLYNYLTEDATLREDPFPRSGVLEVEDHNYTRANHGMVVVPSVGDATSYGYAYIIGGESGSEEDKLDPDDPASDQGSDKVFLGKFKIPDENPSFAPSGFYESEPVDVKYLDGFYWSAEVATTEFTTTTTISMEYRIAFGSSSEPCETPGIFDGVEWTAVITRAPFSNPGTNLGLLRAEHREQWRDDGVQGGCFQYRANLETNDLNQTPRLLNVLLYEREVILPDLRVKYVNPIEEDGRWVNLDVVIENLNAEGKTASADFDADAQHQSYFSVDLFIFTPEDSPSSIRMEQPVRDEFEDTGASLHLYNWVYKADMPAEATFPDPESDQNEWNLLNTPEGWHYANGPHPAQATMTLSDALDTDLFQDTAIYTVCVLVDMYLAEEDPPELANIGRVIERDNISNNQTCKQIDRRTSVWVRPHEAKEVDESDPTDTGAFYVGIEPGNEIHRTQTFTIPFQVSMEGEQVATYDVDYEFYFDEEAELSYDVDVEVVFDEDTGVGRIDVTLASGEERVVLTEALILTFVIEPIPDSEVEGDETLTMSLIGVQTQNEATVTIKENANLIFLPLMRG